MNFTRRALVASAAATVSGLLIPPRVVAGTKHAQPAVHLGLQLYTVNESLERDFDGTLRSIGKIGYRCVEAAGAAGRSALQWRTSLTHAGLRCTSVHLAGDGPAPLIMDFANELGATYVVTALYMLNPTADDAAYRKMLAALALDDYQRMAERCNRLGEAALRKGLRLAYHNENMEFEPKAGRTGYDLLLSETDADLVSFELDCGWAVAAGRDPIEYLDAHKDRFRMLHVKDIQAVEKPTYGLLQGDSPISAELGRGSIDYVPILEAARRARIEQYFVEEEPPFSTPVWRALTIDYHYARALLTT